MCPFPLRTLPLLFAIGTASCTTLLFFDPKVRVDGGDFDGFGGGSETGGLGGGAATGGSAGGGATGGGVAAGGSGGGVAAGGSGGGEGTDGGSGGGSGGGGTAGGSDAGSTGGGSGGGGVSSCTGGGTKCPTATNITSTSVTLTWKANSETDLAGYKIYQSNTSMKYTLPIVLTRGSQTSFTVTGLMSGTTYYFVVTAFDIAGNESGYSDEASVTTL